jgi:hypothetical protein
VNITIDAVQSEEQERQRQLEEQKNDQSDSVSARSENEHRDKVSSRSKNGQSDSVASAQGGRVGARGKGMMLLLVCEGPRSSSFRSLSFTTPTPSHFLFLEPSRSPNKQQKRHKKGIVGSKIRWSKYCKSHPRTTQGWGTPLSLSLFGVFIVLWLSRLHLAAHGFPLCHDHRGSRDPAGVQSPSFLALTVVKFA